jgi:hypothetical protein
MLLPISSATAWVAFSLVPLMVAAATDGVAVEDGADPWLRRVPGGTGRIRPRRRSARPCMQHLAVRT